MKKCLFIKYLFFTLFVILWLTGCITAYKINALTNGMTKADVIQRIGRPSSTSSIDNIEFLNYSFIENFSDWDKQHYTPYYVKLLDGIVVSFGRLGDFNSTKDPTININTNNKVETNEIKVKESDSDKMLKELLIIKELFDKNILTKEEYETKKKQILNKYQL